MVVINQRRLLLGAMAGFLAWATWSAVINFVVLASHYQAAQQAGQVLGHHSYPLYLGSWFLTVLVLSFIAAQFNAWARASLGPGRRTALTVGCLLGLAVAMPIEVTTSRLSIDHIFTVSWIVDLVGGAVLATFVAGWVYKD